jgi:predicted DNA-binding transcriptional regulator AlpA
VKRGGVLGSGDSSNLRRVRIRVVDRDSANIALERMMTAAELGELFGLSAGTILDRFETGDLPGFRLFGSRDKLGRPTGAVRFRESEVLAWIEEQRVTPSIRPEPVA